MQLLPLIRSFFAVILVACTGACSELYVERQFRFISIGMTDMRVAQLFGPPWYEILTFDSGPARTLLHFHHGQVESIAYMEADKTVSQVFFSDGTVKYYGDEATSRYSRSAIRLGMTHVEVETIVKPRQPTEDCKSYVGDARAEYRVCYTNHRAVSKELVDVPPT